MNDSEDYVFVHGGGQAGWVWQETIRALHQQAESQSVRAVALDAPGCGEKRGMDTTGLDVDAVARELLSDIAANGLSEITLVGHSQAGTIIPRLVEMRPDLFQRLVYVSCMAPLSGQSILQQMGSGLRGTKQDEVGWPFDRSTMSPKEGYSRMFCNDMNEAQAAEFLQKLGRDMWPSQTMMASDWRYAHLSSVPSTYVICLQDAVLPVAWQETFAERLKAQQRIRLDAGHQVMNTRPHALAEALRSA